VLGVPHSKGDLRLVDPAEPCRAYEQSVTWNQQGRPGTPGAPGISGVHRVRSIGEMYGDGNGTHFATFECPLGEDVLSVGYRIERVLADGSVTQDANTGTILAVEQTNMHNDGNDSYPAGLGYVQFVPNFDSLGRNEAMRVTVFGTCAKVAP
jgi:hypothetical protein